jgi:hypothetical protein
MHGGRGKGMGPGGRNSAQTQNPDTAQAPQSADSQASLTEDSFEADSTVSA